jgi:hypothetical protein
MDSATQKIIHHTRAWVNRAVVGLNLCPFAKAVQAKDQIRYVVCETSDPEQLLATLCDELQTLASADPAEIETTLLIHPQVLTDFADFNDFLGAAEAAVHQLGFEGVLQVASFHPEYQFAGTAPEDVGNATNRSPYPCLHLLREESIERAVQAFPEPEAIFDANIHTLETLGPQGWAALEAACRQDAEDAEDAEAADRLTPTGR